MKQRHRRSHASSSRQFYANTKPLPRFQKLIFEHQCHTGALQVWCSGSAINSSCFCCVPWCLLFERAASGLHKSDFVHAGIFCFFFFPFHKPTLPQQERGFLWFICLLWPLVEISFSFLLFVRSESWHDPEDYIKGLLPNLGNMTPWLTQLFMREMFSANNSLPLHRRAVVSSVHNPLRLKACAGFIFYGTRAQLFASAHLFRFNVLFRHHYNVKLWNCSRCSSLYCVF